MGVGVAGGCVYVSVGVMLHIILSAFFSSAVHDPGIVSGHAISALFFANGAAPRLNAVAKQKQHYSPTTYTLIPAMYAWSAQDTGTKSVA